MATIELRSQIDLTHWTVIFLDGEWKDMIGDYRIEQTGLDRGQKLEVVVNHYPKFKCPSVLGYCGWLTTETPKAKKGKS
jgi:hypothetical protein